MSQPASTEPATVLTAVRSHTATPLPKPGEGRTDVRWQRLADIAGSDLNVAKLVEPHHDAAAILDDLEMAAPAQGSLWAVWAAEPPFARVTAVRDGARWVLDGTKAFCSGAAFVTDALVSADADDGVRMFAVDVARCRDSGVLVVDEPSWSGPGMRRADTRTIQLTRVPASPAGGPRAYLDRPGFWHGAVGVAACWLGGADAVADPLRRAALRGGLDAHGLAHLGSVTADLEAAWAQLLSVAHLVDTDPEDKRRTAQRAAVSVRSSVAAVAERVVSHVGRALGPGPLAFDAEHAGRVADLQVFVRQHHGERDLAELGSLVTGDLRAE